MARDVKVKITVEGGDQAVGEAKKVSNAFDQMAVRQARAFSPAQLKQYADTLKTIGGHIQDVGKSVQKIGVGLTASLTVTFALLAGQILGLGTSYESSMNLFQATTKATVEEMSLAAKKAKELGADMELPATSAGDAALAMTELAKAGLSVQQSMDAAKGTLQLAAAAQIDEAKAAEITANALNAFKLSATESVRVSDLLAAAANASSAEVTDVAESFQQASAVFAAAKIPIEDLTAAITIMANSGIKGSDAGTSLKTFLERLQAPTDNAASAMKSLGISVFDSAGKIRPMVDIIEDFHGALGKLTDQQKAQALQTIFGSDATRAASILFRDGTNAFMEAKNAITQQGAAADLAAAKTKGLGGAWEGLKSQLETVGIAIFEKISGPLESVTRLVADNVGTFGDWFQSFADANPEIVQIGAAFAALLAVIGPVLVVVGTLIVAIGSVVSTIAAAAAAVGGFVVLGKIILVVLAGLPLVLAQWLPVIAAVGAAIALMYAAWTQNLGGIRDFVIEVFNSVRTSVQNSLNNIQNFWTQHGATIKQTATSAWNSVLSVVNVVLGALVTFARENLGILAESAREILPLIQIYFKQELSKLIVIVKIILGAIKLFWAEWGDEITAIVKTVWGLIKDITQGAIRIVLGMIKTVLGVLTGDWVAVWSGLATILQGVWQIIFGIVKAAGLVVLNIIKGIFTAIWDLGSWLYTSSRELGTKIGEGLVAGIKDKITDVKSAITSVVDVVRNTPIAGWVIKSPSRLFIQYGVWLIQGLIQGIDSQKVALRATMAAVVGIAALTAQAEIASAGAKTKSDKAGVELLKGLFNEIAQSAATTKKAQIELQLLGKEFDGLSPKLRAAILATSEYQDKQKQLADGTQKFTEFQNLLNAALEPSPTLLDELINKLKDKDFIAALDAQAAKLNTTRAALENYLRMLALAASVKDAKFDNVTLPDSPVFEIDANRKLIPDDDPTQQWFDRWEEAYKIAVEQGKRIRDELISIADSVTDIFGHALDRLFEGDFKGFFQSIIQGFKEMFLNIVKDYLLSGLNKILRNLLGVGSGAENSQGSGGGILSGILGRLFGGGGRTSAPPNVGSGTSLAHGGITQNIGDIAHSVQRASLPSPETIVHSSTRNAGNSQVGSLATAGGSALSASKLSFGQQLAGLAPGLGASLGGLLGGNSVGGQILGSLGGLLGGLVLAASTGAIGGSIGGLFALSGALGPAALIAAPLLLLGAFFLGRAKQRKADERSRDQLFGDAVSQMRQLLQQVQTHNVDGASATSQAGEIYSQWYSQVLQIKTKSVRQSALNNQGPVLRNLQAQIAAAAAQQSGELALADRLRPEFATGVFLGRDDQMRDMKALLGRRRNGLLPGVFDARDNIPALLSQGEMVLNPTQQERVRSLAGFDVFSDAGIPNYPRSARPRFEDGGFVGTGITTPSNNNPQSTDKAPIYMTLSFSVDAKGMVETNIKSDSGRRIIATVVNEGIDRKEIRPT